jgi:carboxymethylenebutenolidase
MKEQEEMSGMVHFPSGAAQAAGYLALPEAHNAPAVMVLHAWWGLNDFFQTVCQRLAAEGFVALAPDYYNGNVATSVEEAAQLRQQMDRGDVNKRLKAAVDFLRRHPASNGRPIGLVGFSLGAHLASWLADNKARDVTAVVLFYGTGAGNVARAQASYLGHYAASDAYVKPAGRQTFEARLRAGGRQVTFYVYPQTRHWFFEENVPGAYDASAAHLAWQRTIAFLKEITQA